jgi:HJR/Mrr/RecB family endonuclease
MGGTLLLSRPEWPRLEADHSYFCQALTDLLEANGYCVLRRRAHQLPRAEAAHEYGAILLRDGSRCIALGLRQNLVVTSEVIGRVSRARLAAQAQCGLVVATSFYSPAAVDLARSRRIELFDREHLWRWIERTWS